MAAPNRFRTYAAAIALALAILSTAQAKYSGGTGEPNDPYQIATAADLITLGETPDDYDKHFVLTADIDLDPTLPGGRVFDKAVIGAAWPYFAGVFDGDGHTISNLTINGGDYLGLFGLTESGGVVENLGVVDVNVTGARYHVGGLVGCNQGGSINDCYSTGLVSGPDYVGGLVGSNGTWDNPGASVTNCYSTAVVSGRDYVGGLVGRNVGSISTSYSCGEVDGESCVGGLVGSNNGKITSSYAAGSVAGDSCVGGIIGINGYGCETRSQCSGSLVSNCYSAAAVNGAEDVGGLVGKNGSTTWVTRCFWDTQTSGQTASAGGTGKTTAEMQTARTFLDAGWDFVGETANGTEDIWWVLEGKDYPRLWWELTPRN